MDTFYIRLNIDAKTTTVLTKTVTMDAKTSTFFIKELTVDIKNFSNALK